MYLIVFMTKTARLHVLFMCFVNRKKQLDFLIIRANGEIAVQEAVAEVFYQ